jgi:hypothetical protein
MGKRSSFERIPQDFYPTPAAAVPPLIPHLRGIRTFAEPCCGDGDLVRHLESFGLRCVYSGDISNGQDALAADTYGDADISVTNPPYVKEQFYPLLEHFLRVGPTWLLLRYDWSATRRAAKYLPSCSHIVPVPRLKWFPDTEDSATESHAWYRFDSKHGSGPVLHNDRGLVPSSHRIRSCEHCRKSYEPQRSTSRFCSPACRQRSHHQGISVMLSVMPPGW